MTTTAEANSTGSPPTPEPVDAYVIGEGGRYSLIYASDVRQAPPTHRDAWLTAGQSRRFQSAASAGHVAGLLQQLGLRAQTTPHADSGEESFHIITPEAAGARANGPHPDEWTPAALPGESNARWRTHQAIVIGERQLRADKPNEAILQNRAVPLIVFEYSQGLLMQSQSWAEPLHAILRGRSYVVRTHDPVGGEWSEIRRTSQTHRDAANLHRVWYCPLQDLAGGGLRFPGTWQSVGDAVQAYLKSDDTLYSGARWLVDVIVQVGRDGAFWAMAGTSVFRTYKFAGTQPGSCEWSVDRPVVGSSVVFITALAQALAEKAADLTPAVKKGVASLRRLQEIGYLPPGLVGTRGRGVVLPDNQEMPLFLPKEAIASARVEDVQEEQPVDYGSWEVAKELACGEERVYRTRLTLRVGALDVVDPGYADTLLNVVQRLRLFQKNWAASRGDRNATPSILSLGIYGGPGSGKSFVAKQLAGAADPGGSSFEAVTVNVSQFSSPSDLSDAFERIRSISAKGRVPLVLWDEFDTQWDGVKGGWLAKFLMPMQDAKFMADHEVRTLDSAVFIFIGGTFADEGEFKKWMETREGRQAKGVDFHSRLAAAFAVPTIHVGTDIGDEQREREMPWKAGLDGRGQYLARIDGNAMGRVNRAVLLRSYLRKTHVSRIDADVLTFLLHVPLRHGARSLEQLIRESALDGAAHFRSFHLPPKHVLELHVERSVFEVAANDEQRSIIPALLRVMGVETVPTLQSSPIPFSATRKQ